MEYRRLGNSGLQVSALAFGTYLTIGDSLDKKESLNIIQSAYDLGINFFDTADSYAEGRAEEFLGLALKNQARDSFVISTKCFMPRNSSINARGLSRKNLRHSVEASLKNMKLDYIDVLLCHRFDSETPLEETLRTLDDLISEGKILYWGVSRWTSEQIQEAFKLSIQAGFVKPLCTQHYYNLINREVENLFPVLNDCGMSLLAYSPLAGGVLTGK